MVDSIIGQIVRLNKRDELCVIYIVLKTRFSVLQLYGFSHDEKAHEEHHYEKYPHEEAI